MEETNKTSAELSDEDSRRLLAAIRSNPETAHALATIALGGDPAEVIASLGGAPAEEAAAEPAPEVKTAAPSPEPDEKPALQQPPSSPAFLSHVRESFWD